MEMSSVRFKSRPSVATYVLILANKTFSPHYVRFLVKTSRPRRICLHRSGGGVS